LCRAEDSQRFQQRYASMIYFYAFSLRSVKGNACGSFAASLIFYFFVDEMKQIMHMDNC
jgi:hypothetical protein